MYQKQTEVAKNSNPKNPEALDAYLDVLKKEDAKRRKRRFVYLGAGVLLIPLMTFGVFQLLSPKERSISEEANTFVVYPDRKSTRLNSSHQIISYAVFCLKKKKKNK